jgi:hypothetical protein
MTRTARKSAVASIDIRTLSAEVREFARENGYIVGSRGRVPADLFVEYLMTKPQLARSLARTLGVPVGAKGRVPVTVAVQVGTLLATNKDKRINAV